jgi:hypothetical protein
MRVAKCFYCGEPLSEQHIAHSRETGEYQVTWNGAIGCKKCFLPQRRKEIRGYKEALKRAKKRTGNPVPMYSVSVQREADAKITIVKGKPQIKVTGVRVTLGKLRRLWRRKRKPPPAR